MSALQAAPMEGRVICAAAVASCVCHKDAGHVEAGDPVHSCDPKQCTGKWEGAEPDFVPVEFPIAVRS